MPRCPLCDHVQERGDACEVCGLPLGDGDALAGPVAGLEGLEPHRHAPAPDQAGEQVPGLERARVEGPVPALPPEEPPADWLEPTVELDPAVVVEAVEVERTGGRPERPAPGDAIATCRHCGELVPTGEAFCLRCGMHAVAVRAAAEDAAPRGRCRQCGAAARAGRCPLCGARLPAPEEA